MFTGIITDIGTVRSVSRQAGGDTRLEIATPRPFTNVALGASIALSGACMTVIDQGDEWFLFEVSDESLSKTTLGGWVAGRKINLERALKAGDELGGHYVSGHVDGVGRLTGRQEVAGSLRLTFALPKPFHRLVAPKGSITLDGVSLTVNEVGATPGSALGETEFTVNIIPHTATHTTLGALAVGDGVNFEIDMLARYMARLMETAGA
ncbi:riboflavin synthase [Elstera cyanobacteriorum]|uniref:riboflavin synthase n=1 Tax=Elstera cyanobacteriorum TaxID=2022747 RepID=UPI0023566DC5|nr:riboflavin synthase [Elstera cyanobacteriorum]MCK6442220.1 riboflavin synthase [Elstera cyanobacteriorum]